MQAPHWPREEPNQHPRGRRSLPARKQHSLDVLQTGLISALGGPTFHGALPWATPGPPPLISSKFPWSHRGIPKVGPQQPTSGLFFRLPGSPSLSSFPSIPPTTYFAPFLPLLPFNPSPTPRSDQRIGLPVPSVFRLPVPSVVSVGRQATIGSITAIIFLRTEFAERIRFAPGRGGGADNGRP